jgi:hypothetical protein
MLLVELLVNPNLDSLQLDIYAPPCRGLTFTTILFL